MRLLVNGATRTMNRLLPHKHLGVLVSPGGGNRHGWWPKGTPWAMDNGAFHGFDEKAWLTKLNRCQPDADCLFVVAPDRVADAEHTRTLFDEWSGFIQAKGFPVAYVLQDGQQLNAMPWDDCQAVFVGGSDAFKMSRHAVRLMQAAKERGKWLHMGRVNTMRRLRFALSCQCDSADGSAFSWFSETYLPKYLERLIWLTSQQQECAFG